MSKGERNMRRETSEDWSQVEYECWSIINAKGGDCWIVGCH
jgi:hypothetical protein